MDTEYLDLNKLSKRLTLSPRTLRTRIRDVDDPLPCFTIGSKLLFRWAEVEGWLERRRIQTVDVQAMVEEVINASRRTRSGEGP